jgi:hypothetical protein
MHRIKVTLIAILFFSASAFGQDPEFTQFYANPLYLNLLLQVRRSVRVCR